MAFDEVGFPLRLRYGSNGGPSFCTEVVVCAGGREVRNQGWAQARRRYDARTGIVGAADASALISFFHARAGRARGFRLKDWSDYSSAPDGRAAAGFGDQVIGSGDGVRLTFQLVKRYEAFARVITKPVAGSVLVGVNGAAVKDGWVVDCTKGLVTFASPPAMGAAITAGFLFDVPVRFDSDTLNLTAEDSKTALAEIPLVEVRE